ncbi:MAG: tyrosine decarboxylase MfnA [Promethearchaeota archaeon]
MQLLNENGISETEILEELNEILSKDEQYQTSRILGSMCTRPHDVATKFAFKYPEKNLGDPGLFPGTARLEEECIKMIGGLLGSSDVVGNIVTGGSEANIIAMLVAKKLIKKNSPEVIVPASVHASFYKAADFIGFKLKVLDLNENYEFDLADLEKSINANTIAVVGVAGTTSLGLVDPIAEMGKIIDDSGQQIYFHVDAAFGGFVLPFLKDLGHDVPKFDFSVPAVYSMTSDPHKMGMNLIPSGSFILRKEYHKKSLGFDIPYLAGGSFRHFNIVGTRPGNVVISCWALMKYLGREGYKKIVKTCWENTLYFCEKIGELDKYIGVARDPIMNVVGIVSKTDVKIQEINLKLREKGWYLGLFDSLDPPLMRAVIMPHVSIKGIDEFFTDLKKVLEALN